MDIQRKPKGAFKVCETEVCFGSCYLMVPFAQKAKLKEQIVRTI